MNVRDFSVSPDGDDDIWGGANNAKRQDRDLRSSVSVHIQLSYFKRVDVIMINLGCPNGTVLGGNLCDVGVCIYVSLDNQLPSLFVDSAKITGLGLVLLGKEGGEALNALKQTDQKGGCDTVLTRMFLGGSQLGHFAAALLIRSMYLR